MIPALIVILVLAVLVLAAAWAMWDYVFHSPKPPQNDIYNLPPEDQYIPYLEETRRLIGVLNAMPCERVKMENREGMRLFARYYAGPQGAPLAIFFHGYRSTSMRDGCGGIPLLLKEGLSVLLVDQRAHGRSQGNTIGFGVTERLDCMDWIAYARERFGEDIPIYLYGISMGAATVLMAADQGLPANVRGIVADCPYSSPKEIICKVGKDTGFNPKLMYPIVRLGARLFGHFDPESADAIRAVKETPVPILLIHGEDDRFVPCEMSEAIRQANPDAITRYTFPNAAHGNSYMYDTERYRKLVLDFMGMWHD